MASESPQFVSQLDSQITVNEGEGCAMNIVAKPANDPTLDVVWAKSGNPLEASSRYFASFDRGYAALEFLYTNPTDSGEYCCIAKNSQGQIQSNVCVITVIPEAKTFADSFLQEESRQMNEEPNENSGQGEENKIKEAPTFARQLFPQLNVKENEGAKFETFIQPANDPSLVVEWMKDGAPLKTGCRFRTLLDRGLALLEIVYCNPEDTGDYACLAKNSVGSVQSNVVQLTCKPGVSVDTESSLSDASILYIKNLESYESSSMALYSNRYLEADGEHSAPSFEITPVELTAVEGSPVRLLVKAGGYPHPRVQWFINGDVVPMSGGGGAWRIYSDGGISYLELNRCGPPGEYNVTIVAKNKMGESTINTKFIVEPQLDYRPDLKHIAPENPFKKLTQLKKVERMPELNRAFEKPKANAVELRKLERRPSLTSAEATETEGLYSRVQASLRAGRINNPPVNSPAPFIPAPQPAKPKPAETPKPQPVFENQMMSGGGQNEAEYSVEETSAEFSLEI